MCAFKKDQIMNNTKVVESRNERSETKALRCNLRAVLLLVPLARDADSA
jgi:hypothetical protein